MIQVLREKHEAPQGVAERLRVAGGVNWFGEPNFRAVWGWNRLDWIGGKWTDRNAAGEVVRERVELRLEPKYSQVNRWHIEKWMPAEAYGSPRSWRMQTMEREDGVSIPALGPYPARGDYEHVMTLESPDGGFAQLTPTIAERIARLVALSGQVREKARMSALRRREERRDEEYDKWAWDLMSDTPQYPALKVSVL